MGKEGKQDPLVSKCQHYLHLMWLIPSFVVGACGGGGSSGGIVGPDGVFGDLEYNACESTYYQNITGRFSGTVEYRLTNNQEVLRAHCIFDVDLEIAGTPLVAAGRADRCQLSASFTTAVEQLVFLEFGDPLVHECRAEQGALLISDPNASVINPEIFYENISYPVQISTIGPESVLFGPYLGNVDQIVPYQYLFGSARRVAEGLRALESGQIEIFDSPSPNTPGLSVNSDLTRSEE